MGHQDFEKYAYQKSMKGVVADRYIDFFLKNIEYQNSNFKILDFGCGDGRYLSFFKQFFKKNNIFGVEISQTRYERCKKIGWENVFKINKLEKLPFDEQYFDCINFEQVIEHIQEDEIEFYLKEFIRILKNNGKMIFLTPNYPIKRFYDIFHGIRNYDIKRIFDDPTHVSKYNFNKLYKLLSPYFGKVVMEPTGGLFYSYFKNKSFGHKIIGIAFK